MDETKMNQQKGAILATMEELGDNLKPDEIRSIERYLTEPLNKGDLDLAENMLLDIMQYIKAPMEIQRLLSSYRN